MADNGCDKILFLQKQKKIVTDRNIIMLSDSHTLGFEIKKVYYEHI